MKCVLLAEAKLGELIIKTVESGGSRNRTADGKFKGAEPTLPNGINKKESHQAHIFSDKCKELSEKFKELDKKELNK